MGRVGNIGSRIELTAMDAHFHETTVGLYEQVDVDGAPCYVVHSYSQREGIEARLDRIMEVMSALGGMVAAKKGAPALRFACGYPHRAACKRAFVEACKYDPDGPLSPKAMSVYDKKSEALVEAIGDGKGGYTITPIDDDANRVKRAAAIAKGLVKLAEMSPAESGANQVFFDCGQAHDELVGLLLGRAINVRASMREAEEAASRGVLAAPSAQQS